MEKIERTEELFDRIEGYLNNTLSAEDRTHFEKQVEQDASLAIELEKHRELQRVLSDKKTLDFREKLKNIHQEVVGEQQETGDIAPEEKNTTTSIPITKKLNKESNKKESKFTYWKLGIAAVFVLGVGTLLWDNSAPTSAELYDTYYTPFTVDDTTRGAFATALEKVFEAYADGNYQQTIPAFEEALKEKNNTKLQLFLGNSYLNTNQEEKAKHQFDHIGPKSMFYEDAQWYMAMTYLKLKVTDSSKFFLKKVIDYKGIHEKKAQELLAKLK